jgi:Family of unknown function (DUF6221)
VSGDLTARVAELAALIAANLAVDEAAALATSGDDETARSWDDGQGGYPVTPLVDDGWGRTIVHGHATSPTVAAHIARNDPARRLRDVRATRDLVAAILAEPHDWNAEDQYYSCSQAVDPDPYPGESGGPGSGCPDPERSGKPCDCGRDARVARLLGIIASERED